MFDSKSHQLVAGVIFEVEVRPSFTSENHSVYPQCYFVGLCCRQVRLTHSGLHGSLAAVARLLLASSRN